MLFVPVIAHANIIINHKSDYQQILAFEKNEMRSLFTIKKDEKFYQGSVFNKNTNVVYDKHTQALICSLLLNRSPKRVLILGQGTGLVASIISKTVASALVETVDSDRDYVNIVKTLFKYDETDRAKTYIASILDFIRSAEFQGNKYDIIIVNTNTILTKNVLTKLSTLLNSNGIIAAKTLKDARLYSNESVTYNKVFGDYFNVVSKESDYRVLLAAKDGSLPDVETIRDNARFYFNMFYETYGINIDELLPIMDNEKDWKLSAKVITDQNLITLLAGNKYYRKLKVAYKHPAFIGACLIILVAILIRLSDKIVVTRQG